MLADPRYSQLVLINPARCGSGSITSGSAARWNASLSLLPAALEIVNVKAMVIGEYNPSGMPEQLAARVSWIDVDGLSMWRDERFKALLAGANTGVIFLGGAWLEEEVLIAALKGAGLGYDLRLLADLSIARLEADRPLVLDRLAQHGVLAATLRQAVLEWACVLNDSDIKLRVQRLLS